MKIDSAQGAWGMYLVFILDELSCALPLSAVERVVRAVEVTPLPKAPEIVLGVINARGRVIPVIDLRSRFRLPYRDMLCDDRLILMHTPRRMLALAADDVAGIRELALETISSAEGLLPSAGYLRGVAILDDGLVLINDIDSLLSLDEEAVLDNSLEGTFRGASSVGEK